MSNVTTEQLVGWEKRTMGFLELSSLKQRGASAALKRGSDHSLVLISTKFPNLNNPELGPNRFVPTLGALKELKRLSLEHGFSFTKLDDLRRWVEGHPLVVEPQGKRGFIVFLDIKDSPTQGQIVGMSVRGSASRLLETSREPARTYTSDEVGELLADTVVAGGRVFANERTEDWARRSAIQFPDLAASPVYSEHTLKRIAGWDSLDLAENDKDHGDENPPLTTQVADAKSVLGDDAPGPSKDLDAER